MPRQVQASLLGKLAERTGLCLCRGRRNGQDFRRLGFPGPLLGEIVRMVYNGILRIFGNRRCRLNHSSDGPRLVPLNQTRLSLCNARRHQRRPPAVRAHIAGWSRGNKTAVSQAAPKTFLGNKI